MLGVTGVRTSGVASGTRHRCRVALIAVATLALGSCASAPSPLASTSPSPAAAQTSATSTAHPTSRPSPTPATTPAPAADVYLDAQQGPYFSGVAGTFTISASRVLPLAGTEALGIGTATIDFGDGGPPLGVTGSCAAAPEPTNVTHAYPASGEYTASVVAVTLCTPTSSIDDSDVAAVLVLPSASAAQAQWPTCSTFQLHLTGGDEGAGLGHAEVLIKLRNVSSRGCTLSGYPRLQLVSPAGSLLLTAWHEASDGDYMFPAIGPHLVAIGPGGYASFLVGLLDNPSSSNENVSHDVACPPVRWVRVILPGTNEYGTAEISIAPCDGWVNVSAIYPGDGRIMFQ
jgi:hypothetical protein